MTEVERVWERLKERAALRAAASGATVSMTDAMDVATAICAQECRQQPPADAIEYFASEFVRLTSEAHAARSATAGEARP
jgi:hypothetical protein